MLITGAGRGLGVTLAEEFAKEGANLVLVDINEEGLSDTNALVVSLGAQAIAVAADVSKRSDVQKMIADAVDTFGQLDVAINNAAIDQAPEPFIDSTDEMFSKVIDVNYRGVWLCMQEQIKAMLTRESGTIINVTALSAHVGVDQFAMYASTKHAVLGLTRCAALEYANQGIRVNAISPAGINTPMHQEVAKQFPEYVEIGKAKHPIGRIAETVEIARAVLFLASEDASFVVGHALRIDGGYTVA